MLVEDHFVEPKSLSEVEKRMADLQKEKEEIEKSVERVKTTSSPSRAATLQSLSSKLTKVRDEANYLRNWLKPEAIWPPPVGEKPIVAPLPRPEVQVKQPKVAPPPPPKAKPPAMPDLKPKQQILRERAEEAMKLFIARQAGAVLTSTQAAKVEELAYLWGNTTPEPLLFDIYARGLIDEGLGLTSLLPLAATTRKEGHYALIADRWKRLYGDKDPNARHNVVEYTQALLRGNKLAEALQLLEGADPSATSTALCWLLIALYMSNEPLLQYARKLGVQLYGSAKARFFIKAYSMTGAEEDMQIALTSYSETVVTRHRDNRLIHALCRHGKFDQARAIVNEIPEVETRWRCQAMIAAFTQRESDTSELALNLKEFTPEKNSTMRWLSKALTRYHAIAFENWLATSEMPWALRCVGYSVLAGDSMNKEALETATSLESQTADADVKNAGARLELIYSQLAHGNVAAARGIATRILDQEKRGSACIALYAQEQERLTDFLEGLAHY